MHRYLVGLFFFMVVGCVEKTNAELPKNIVPGVSEQSVRTFLKVEKCAKRPVDPSLTDCDAVETKLLGRSAKIKVIFHNDKLAFSYIHFDASEFTSLIPIISQMMGSPKNQLNLAVSELPKPQTFFWGNDSLFVSLTSTGFGDNKSCMLALQLPESVPPIMHPLFLQSMDKNTRPASP